MYSIYDKDYYKKATRYSEWCRNRAEDWKEKLPANTGRVVLESAEQQRLQAMVDAYWKEHTYNLRLHDNIFLCEYCLGVGVSTSGTRWMICTHCDAYKTRTQTVATEN